MNKTTRKEEIEFLKGYVEFSPQARVLEAEALWNKAKKMKPCDKRAILYLLTIGSFFMQQETLYKFLRATKAAANGKDYLSTLLSTMFNPGQDISKIFSTEDLNMKYPSGLSKTEKEKIKKRFDNLIKTCRDLRKANVVFLSVYYCLKHGFMVYKKNGDILSLMHKEKEKKFVNYIKELGIKGEKNSLRKNDFSYLIDLNKRIACAIQDVIVIRLIQLGITTL